jgi:hypothetical protein
MEREKEKKNRRTAECPIPEQATRQLRQDRERLLSCSDPSRQKEENDRSPNEARLETANALVLTVRLRHRVCRKIGAVLSACSTRGQIGAGSKQRQGFRVADGQGNARQIGRQSPKNGWALSGELECDF